MSDAEITTAIESAARTLGARVGDVSGYYQAGGEWDAETPESLAELIVECWAEQQVEASR
jgi:hypothetical protein